MTSVPSPSDRDETIELSDQCAEYLLGELSSQQLATFEKTLAESPDLNRQLLAHADLLCALGTVQPAPVNTQETCTTDASVQPNLARRVVAVIATLAATIAFATVGLRYLPIERPGDTASPRPLADSGDAPGSDEALLIAQAWASSQPISASDNQWSPAEPELDSGIEEPADVDSVLAWMVIGVMAETETPSGSLTPTESGETSDG